MNLLTDDNGNRYFISTDEVKPEYYPIKVCNILQFYRLDSRKTVISKDNVIPILNVNYLVFSPHEKKYYLRVFRNWTVSQGYFYRKDLDFSGEDTAIENLKRYITDDNVWLILAKDEIEVVSNMLKRLWKSHFVTSGKLPYKSWIELLEVSLDLEDYRYFGKDLMGYKTICHRYEMHIKAIWDEAYKSISKITQK